MQRRIYQIQHDLKSAFGDPGVVFNVARAKKRADRGWRRWGRRLAQEIRRCLTNPLRAFSWSAFSTHELNGEILKEVRELFFSADPCSHLVLDYPGFADLPKFMGLASPQTAYATHHIEAMAQNQHVLAELANPEIKPSFWSQARASGVELIAELRALGAAGGIFPISQMETAFLRAVGLSAVWYPYQPKGETLEWCQKIKQMRDALQSKQNKYFLSCATGNIHNRKSLLRVLEVLVRQGLPQQTRLVLTGIEESVLRKMNPTIPLDSRSFEIRGWVDEEEFSKILAGCAGQIVASELGFGAHTRLADSAACGIPVITHRRVVETSPVETAFAEVRDQNWRDALEACLRGELRIVPGQSSPNPFESWLSTKAGFQS